MLTRVMRKMVKIDEEKCDGCGNCVIACAEGAIQIIDGKARLISESYCDGLGACLGECPQEAISIEEREGDAFDEEAVKHHLEETKAETPLPCGCPSTTVRQFERASVSEATGSQESMLTHWPVHLSLVPPNAPFLKGANLLLASDCVPFAYAGFHQDFIKGRAVVFGCPKLDDIQAHRQKLAQMLQQSDVQSLTVVHMEVPCCSGLVYLAKEAIAASGKHTPLKEVTVGIQGDLK